MSLLPAGRNLLICGVRKSQTGVNGRMQARRRTVNFWRKAKKNSHLLFSLYLPFVPFYWTPRYTWGPICWTGCQYKIFVGVLTECDSL